MEIGLRLVLVDPPHDLGRLDQRVVGAERLGAVARDAADGQSAPVDALLTDDDRQPGRAVGADHREAARLGDHVVGADVVGGVPAEPLGAEGGERLLVGDRGVGEIARRAEAASGEVPEAGCHGGGEVEHVDRSPPPDDAVDELAAEGVV